jgi:hypothetical protein
MMTPLRRSFLNFLQDVTAHPSSDMTPAPIHTMVALTTFTQALEAMFTEQGYAPQALGDRVRAASKLEGPWPKISIWHGTCDPIVKPSNGEDEDIVRQWTNVHGLSESPSHEGLVENFTLTWASLRRRYGNGRYLRSGLPRAYFLLSVSTT